MAPSREPLAGALAAQTLPRREFDRGSAPSLPRGLPRAARQGLGGMTPRHAPAGMSLDDHLGRRGELRTGFSRTTRAIVDTGYPGYTDGLGPPRTWTASSGGPGCGIPALRVTGGPATRGP